MFDIFAKQTIFIVRYLRIHPVQSVVNNITQLPGMQFFPQLVLFDIFAKKKTTNGRQTKSVYIPP